MCMCQCLVAYICLFCRWVAEWHLHFQVYTTGTIDPIQSRPTVMYAVKPYMVLHGMDCLVKVSYFVVCDVQYFSIGILLIIYFNVLTLLIIISIVQFIKP